MDIGVRDKKLVGWLSGGLPLVARPYAVIGQDLGLSEPEVRADIKRLQDSGALSRFGVVVRHHELGYRANGMVVWNFPDETVRDFGRLLSEVPCVTLCYRRPRKLPEWPYNLFTMIHGKAHEETLKNLAELVRKFDLQQIPMEILFSTKRYKQRGASYGLQQRKEAS